MTTPQSRSTERETGLRATPAVWIALITCLTLACAVFVNVPTACAKQSRAACRECCEKMGYDDYYKEQCKLKCFRNSDHCTSAAARPKPKPKPEPTQEKRTKRRKPSRSRGEIVFKWPNPLTLTPGKERDAAAQILAVNGMPPNHPNYMLALRSIEGVLQNFARQNPQGGKLPTNQLVDILLKYR